MRPAPHPGGTAGPEEAGTTSCWIWWATSRWHPALLGLLDDAERARAERLRSAVDRADYLTAHALVRLLLGPWTGERPSRLRFRARCRRCGGSHGKPELAADQGGMRVAFSLSHAGDHVAVAVTDGAAVGVDLEHVRRFDPRELTALSSEVLSRSERAAFLDLPPALRAGALATWWVRKESVLKATGHGLSIPPRELQVTDPATLPSVTGWPPGIGAAPPVLLRDLEPGGALVASVAVLTSDRLTVRQASADPLLAAAQAGSQESSRGAHP